MYTIRSFTKKSLQENARQQLLQLIHHMHASICLTYARQIPKVTGSGTELSQRLQSSIVLFGDGYLHLTETGLGRVSQSAQDGRDAGEDARQKVRKTRQRHVCTSSNATLQAEGLCA